MIMIDLDVHIADGVFYDVYARPDRLPLGHCLRELPLSHYVPAQQQDRVKHRPSDLRVCLLLGESQALEQ